MRAVGGSGDEKTVLDRAHSTIPAFARGRQRAQLPAHRAYRHRPAEYIARRSSLSATPELIEQIRTTLGLDKPLHIRYLNWIGGVLHGDFGRSIFTGHSVGQDLQSYFPPTLKLVALSMALIVVFTIPVSLVSAARRGRLSDHIVRGVSIVGICLPPFWLGFLLLLAFAVERPYSA